MALPFINGVQYHWAQVAVRGLGNIFVGIEGIDYEETQEIVNNYGAGNFPIGQGLGKIDAKGTITLYQEELEALQNAAPGRRLQAIPNFDITVSFIPDAGQAIVNHTIRNIRLTANKRELKSGDTKVVVQIPYIASHIDW
jgi:hypothetical protein